MPLVIHPRIRTGIGRLLALTVVGVFAGAGAAVADCAPQPLSTPFAHWGDNANYLLVPGGSFEGSPADVGWTLSNASLTQGNEPFAVNAAGDAQSLTIDAGGTATSPFFCVDNTMTNLRFFAQQLTGGSDLDIRALVQSSDGGTYVVPLGSLADGSLSSWAPTQPIAGDSAALADGQTVQVALQLSVPASAGAWQVDDIYVDPFRTG